MTKEEKKKEEKKKKEVKKVVKKTAKKSSDKVVKKVVNPVRGLPSATSSATSSATPLATVISNGVKKTLIVKKPVKKVVKKISKPVAKKLVEEIKKEDKKVIKKPIIKEGKEEIEMGRIPIPIIKQKSDKEYYKGIGRRKRAVANVRLFLQGDKIFTINNKPADMYFNNVEYQKIIHQSLEKMNLINKFKVQVLVRGGGLHAQAEAVRHGISRALLDFDNKIFRERLKMTGFLTRDPRRRERKKPGLKRARKATQWRKR